MKDERLHTALYGQGVIGAWAGPRDPGTASIKLMHFSGELEGVPMAWGYVEGGMGRISFAIAEAAQELGAVLAAGCPSREILPGEGVVLEGGDLIRARHVISNADPKVTLAPVRRRRAAPSSGPGVDGWRMKSPVMKVNCGLNRLPAVDRRARTPTARTARWSRSRCRIDDAQAAFERCTRGVPRPGFAELYFQTAYDPSVAPRGQAHDERLRAVRAVHARRRRPGRRAATRSAPGARSRSPASPPT